MTSHEKKPLEWIRLELIPLPNFSSKFQTLVVWWNPQEGVFVGDDSEINALVVSAEEAGKVNVHPGGLMEITNPMNKPSELAAILGQYFWVVPEPVAAPYADASLSTEELTDKTPPTLQ